MTLTVRDDQREWDARIAEKFWHPTLGLCTTSIAAAIRKGEV